MTRYAKKPDTNHGEIRDALRAIPGMRVLDTAAMAGLGCDLMAQLSDNQAMYWQRQAALDAGFDNCGDEFWAMLSAAADSRIQASSEPKFGDEVAAILARQG
jgi:hypothetical protein